MTFPSTRDDRYGVASPGRHRLLRGLVVVVVAGFAGWLAWATWFHATPDVDSEFLGFDVVDGQTSSASVSVALGAGVEARCVVRALAEDHGIVGELSFVPRDGRNDVTIRTERQATTVTLVGCTAAGQPRPR